MVVVVAVVLEQIEADIAGVGLVGRDWMGQIWFALWTTNCKLPCKFYSQFIIINRIFALCSPTHIISVHKIGKERERVAETKKNSLSQHLFHILSMLCIEYSLSFCIKKCILQLESANSTCGRLLYSKRCQ